MHKTKDILFLPLERLFLNIREKKDTTKIRCRLIKNMSKDTQSQSKTVNRAIKLAMNLSDLTISVFACYRNDVFKQQIWSFSVP